MQHVRSVAFSCTGQKMMVGCIAGSVTSGLPKKKPIGSKKGTQVETIICPECGEETRVVLMDFGFGAYEYWGARGVHVDKRWVMECCQTESPDDLIPDEPDRDWDIPFPREEYY